jgi:hypothetical protein
MGLADDILRTHQHRVGVYADVHSGMAKVRQTYYGELNIPLPEIDGMTKPPIPNLLQTGVDQLGGRIVSTVPIVQVLARTPSRTERRRAQTAEKVLTAWWQKDRLPLKMKRRARHYIAYGLSTCDVTWDHKEHRPKWEVRNPLATYPDPDLDHESPAPNNIITTYERTCAWLRASGYAQNIIAVNGRDDLPESHIFTILDYRDKDIRAVVLVGNDKWSGKETASILTLDEHNLGITPASVAIRTGLDRLNGQFDQMLSMYESQALLMALEILAVQRGIFPDTYLVSRPGEIARFIDGPHDGRTGKVNIIAGGDYKSDTIDPGYVTTQVIDRLERNSRVTGRLPADFGGEAATNVRTGRRGDALLSATIDMDVADAQDALSNALAYENEIAARLALKHDKTASRSIYVQIGSADKSVTYIADKVFTETDNTVNYPANGSDINQLIVGVGQRVGLGTMSKQTAAELDPYIDDAEVEHDRIVAEGLEQALLSGIQQQASTGALPPLVLAKVMDYVRSDRMELAQAMNKVTEEAMKEQQAQADAQAQQGQPAPGMTPDMAMAGPAAAAMTGNPQAASPIPGVGPGMGDLSSMLADLRMPMNGMGNTVGVEGAV